MRAIISVFDKQGVAEFAQGLIERGVEIYSTGKTLAALTHDGVPARSISELTGFPEILEGRVKTLHPLVHGGILFRRDHSGDIQEVAEHDIGVGRRAHRIFAVLKVEANAGVKALQNLKLWLDLIGAQQRACFTHELVIPRQHSVG